MNQEAATHSDKNPEKRANETNERFASEKNKQLVVSLLLLCNVMSKDLLSLQAEHLFSAASDPTLVKTSVSLTLMLRTYKFHHNI